MSPVPTRKTRRSNRNQSRIAKKQWIAYSIILVVLISVIITIALAGHH
ncbi:MAG: hypothetical protein ACTSWC_04595 [Promethearchaeota archaeon]